MDEEREPLSGSWWGWSEWCFKHSVIFQPGAFYFQKLDVVFTKENLVLTKEKLFMTMSTSCISISFTYKTIYRVVKDLPHFMPLVSFFTPWKYQKTSDLFWGGIEDQWHEMS